MRDRRVFDQDHDQFREVVREFIRREIAPVHEKWEADGIVDRAVWAAAARHGLIGFNVPAEYGGLGIDDFRYNAVVIEELAASGSHGPVFSLHNDVIAPYLLTLATPEQKLRWLPGFAAGELIFAIAMTEPGTGSDLRGVTTSARREGSDWILSGQKTFISNGIISDAVIVVTRTGEVAGAGGFSLLVVERGMPGFERGRNLAKIGMHAQDTAELFFDDVRVPAANVLGEEGGGFKHLMHNLPAERLSIALHAVAASRALFAETLRYVSTRTAFGSPIGSFQANRFSMAELDTEIDLAEVFADDCLAQVGAGTLSAVTAAKAKWWTTELHQRVVSRCLQLHGGYGYMLEYPVARAYLDARIETIYGGTTELMKEIIGRSLGL